MKSVYSAPEIITSYKRGVSFQTPHRHVPPKVYTATLKVYITSLKVYVTFLKVYITFLKVYITFLKVYITFRPLSSLISKAFYFILAAIAKSTPRTTPKIAANNTLTSPGNKKVMV